MKNQIIFLIIVLASSFLGIFIAVLNNDIVKEKPSNLKNDNVKKSKNEEQNINSGKTKNEINKIKDFIDDEDDEDNNNNKNETNNNSNITNKVKEKNNQNKPKENNLNVQNTQVPTEQNAIEYKKGMNNVHISLSIDNKFIYPLIVFLTSLLENRASTTFYMIHILTSKNLNKDYYDKINKVIDKYGKDASKISFYNMGDDFKGAITGIHISLASYYRIALPSLLPNVDKIIYSDTDVINFKDLSEMYSLQFKDKVYFMGTLDNPGLVNELKQLRVYTQKYMNAGILLMNLKGMRQDGIEQKIRKYIFSHYLDHHDQTAINAVCYDNFEILSVKYATFVYNSLQEMKNQNDRQNKIFRYNDNELNMAFYEPTLLHYVGWTKPWDKKYGKIYGEYWWYYAKKSGFYEEIIKNYGLDKNNIEKLLKKIPDDGGLMKHNYKK